MRYGDVGRYKNIDGQVFGVYKVIGFTGKTDKYNRQMCVARNTRTGQILIAPKVHFTSGSLTGYTNSLHHKKISGELRGNLSDAQNKKREIKLKISRYKNSKGVRFRKDRNKWVAEIAINKKRKRLGHFNTEQQAIQARKKAVDEQIKILKQELERL